MLHGTRRKDQGNKALKKPQSRPTQKVPQYQQAPAPDHRTNTTSQQQQPARTSNLKGWSDFSSHKRKAEGQPEQRPAQRRTPLKDEAYVRSNFRVPTLQDYPELPKGFFKQIKSSVVNATTGLAELRSEFVPLAKDAFQCTLHFESAARTEVVVGEGRSQKTAETAAYFHLLANFHEQEILGEVLNRKSDLNQINQQSMKRERENEKDALTDIYNYAARFETVPNIKTEVMSVKERGRRRKYVDLTVELSKQGIKVTGRGADSEIAEMNTGKLFKQEAERYHAERGSEAIVIKDSGALTTENASQFLEFYKILRPGIKIESENQPPDNARIRGHFFRIQVKINGEPVGEPVEMVQRKKAEKIAQLTAAIALRKNDQELYPRFLRALKSGHGQILRPVTPIDLNVDEDCSLVMRETLLAARKAGLPDEVKDVISHVAVPEDVDGGSRRQMSADELKERNWLLKQRLSFYLQDENQVDLRNKKAALPMNQHGTKVLDLVNNNVYSIIVGATGSGKTTQVPQILLEDAIAKGQGAACNIICTQPRRIAATSVARRVADERVEKLQESIGYHVRFDARPPRPGGSVTYCTTGILLQRLQHHPDEVMDCNSHLVVDEVHERDMQIDFLLILLKKIITRRRAQGKTVPRVVLMSATMDTELFAAYFKTEGPGKGSIECPSLSVPGRTFPVKERYLDEIVKDLRAISPSSELQAMYLDRDSKDYLDSEESYRVNNPTSGLQEISNTSRDEVSVIDWKRERKFSSEDSTTDVLNEKENALIPFGLVACTIAHIAKTSREGAILVFLPGLAEIIKVEETLKSYNFGVDFAEESKFKMFMLHSSISTSQNTVFEPVPEGCRKIILTTNIAETSVTIPDVQYVVDTGKLREKQYDQTRRISQLLCTWISKSNAKQRAGRAGRVQNGNYYALYTKQRYDSLRAIGLPELLRVDLQEICLNIKAQAFNTPIRDFLAEAIEPPSASAVDASVVNLEALDALTDEEEITPLGRLLSSLPVHPSLGKMIVLGIIFRCLDPMLILGAASAERPLFLNPLGARHEAHEAKLSFIEGSGSDHIAILNAVRTLRRVRDDQGERTMRDHAHRNFLHGNAFKTIDSTAKQILDILIQAGLVPPTRRIVDSQFGDPTLNENSWKVPLIKALVLAGSHPNLAVSTGGRAFRTPGERSAIVHPSSVNALREQNRGDRDKIESTPRYGTMYSYSTMARSNDATTLFLRDTTESTPLMATLFGGKLQRNAERGNIVEVDGWLPFYVTSQDRRTAKTIVEFRKALERLLAVAFKDLGRLSAKKRVAGGLDGSGGKTFFADERVRELFAGGLVEVLDRDVKVREGTARRGWGAAGFSVVGGPGRARYSGRVVDRSKSDRAAASKGGDRAADRGSGGGEGKDKMPGFYQDMMKI